MLYKKLFGLRYLIVLDDMWCAEIWDEIKYYFPDNGTKSRILITSRLRDLFFCDFSFFMSFLDEDRSWKLLCEKAFGEDVDCPFELEKIGKKIAQQCRGLPLSIVVIGSHLRKSSRTVDYWEFVADNINSLLMSSAEDGRCFNILYLSYAHLPVHLKPCFLYMGMFQEDEVIESSSLVKLWVAEGFLKPNKEQSMEEIAESHLMDLVDRNLISVQRCSRNGKVKTCYIHKVLRDLCLVMAEKEKFLCVLKHTPRPLERERRLAIHGGFGDNSFGHDVFGALKSAHLVRTVMWKAGELHFHFKLLKILKVGPGGKKYLLDVHYLKSKFEQVNLRYLSRELNWIGEIDDYKHRQPRPPLHLPSSIRKLWSLQTLIIKGRHMKIIAPSEIWKMPQLRHIDLELVSLPDPPTRRGRNDAVVLLNLQTLSKVENFKTSEEVCKRMPNVSKMEISYNGEVISSDSECFQHNIGCFSKLDSLKCDFMARHDWPAFGSSLSFPSSFRKLFLSNSCFNSEASSSECFQDNNGCFNKLDSQINWRQDWRDFALSLSFPSSLRKLCLRNSCPRWGDLTTIGLLPNLQVLKLSGGYMVGEPEWTPVEGNFLHLKYLQIKHYELIEWNAQSSHFPVLESLVLIGLSKLSEIPSGMGDIPTLGCISLKHCSLSAAISAMRIVAEQKEYGNEDIRVEVEFGEQKESEMFREMVKEEGFTTNNLHLTN